MPDNIDELRGEESVDKIREGLKAGAETPDNDDTGVDDEVNEDGDKSKDTTKPSDKEAKLLKEVMKLKADKKKAADDLAAAKALVDGLDLDAVKQMLADKETAENAALEKKGEYDRLLQKQRDAADAKIAAEKKRADDLEATVNNMRRSMEDLTTGQAFSNSKFVAEKLTLTPNKAKALYKSHFEYVDGKMVGYDKPAGEGDRTPIVDSDGNNVDFEAAIAAIIDADPDKDYLLKSETKSGSGSKPSAPKPQKQADYSDTTDKIAAGLEAMFKASGKK